MYLELYKQNLISCFLDHYQNKNLNFFCRIASNYIPTFTNTYKAQTVNHFAPFDNKLLFNTMVLSVTKIEMLNRPYSIDFN